MSDQAPETAKLHTEIDSLKDRNADLMLALEAAVGLLFLQEPGDSRAVSEEFVALASVVADNANDQAWEIIQDIITRLNDMEDKGNYVHFSQQPETKLTVKLGKELGDYMLPADVVDNKLVQQMIKALKTKENEQLRLLTRGFFTKITGLPNHGFGHDLDIALNIMTSPEVAILEEIWFYDCPEMEKEFQIEPEERESIIKENVFAHPHTGLLVPDFRKHLNVAWSLNMKNQEFLEWKSS